MEFQTHRLNIREFVPGDKVHIHRIAASPGFVFYNLDGTEPNAESFVNKAIELQEQSARSSFKMAVEAKANPGHCIGYITVDDLDGTETGTPDIGYLIDPREQGKGFATEAMVGLMQQVFAVNQDVDDIWLTVHPDNVASQRVAEKLSFERCGEKTIETARGTEPRYIYKTDRARFEQTLATPELMGG